MSSTDVGGDTDDRVRLIAVMAAALLKTFGADAISVAEQQLRSTKRDGVTDSTWEEILDVVRRSKRQEQISEEAELGGERPE